MSRAASPASLASQPSAPLEAVGEREPGTGQDEPLVSGADSDDDEELPVARGAAAASASADPVKDYLKQIGKVPLLNARQEVELAKRIEAGLFAEEKLAEGSGVLPGRPEHRARGWSSRRQEGQGPPGGGQPAAWSSRWPGGTPAGACCSWT